MFDEELKKASVRENIRDALFYRDHDDETDFIDYERANEREKFLNNYKGPKDYEEAEILYKECMHSYFGGLTIGNFLEDVWDDLGIRMALLTYMVKKYNDMNERNPDGLNIWDKQNLFILDKVARYLLEQEKVK